MIPSRHFFLFCRIPVPSFLENFFLRPQAESIICHIMLKYATYSCANMFISAMAAKKIAAMRFFLLCKRIEMAANNAAVNKRSIYYYKPQYHQLNVTKCFVYDIIIS